jgi:cytochrome c-type biogenesis protein CcmE
MDPDLNLELEKALETSARIQKEAQEPEAKPVVFGAHRARSRGSPFLLFALVAFAGGIAALVLTSFKGAAVYSKTVDEVVRDKSALAGRRLRVDGNLVHGSLVRRDKPCEYRFAVERGKSQLRVQYAQCVVPDTFRDVPDTDIAVTIEGTLNAAGDLQATQIMAKCPAKYDLKKRLVPGGPTYDGVPAAPGPAKR